MDAMDQGIQKDSWGLLERLVLTFILTINSLSFESLSAEQEVQLELEQQVVKQPELEQDVGVRCKLTRVPIIKLCILNPIIIYFAFYCGNDQVVYLGFCNSVGFHVCCCYCGVC